MGCEYCISDGKSRKWLNSTNNKTRIKLGKKFGGRTYKEIRMYLQWNSWKMRKEVDNNGGSFKINFCPMCGAELNKGEY